MRLVCSEYGIEIELQENQTGVLLVENSRVFQRMIYDLINQDRVTTGMFVLSEKDKICNLSKEAEIIINPFSLDCNEKRVQQKLFQEILEKALGDNLQETTELNRMIVSYLESITLSMPYNITFELEENIQGLLKIYGVAIEQNEENLLEKIINYLCVLSRLCKIKYFFFVNLKTFLETEELEKLYEFAAYEKMHFILLENKESGQLSDEKWCILDKDLCIIKCE